MGLDQLRQGDLLGLYRDPQRLQRPVQTSLMPAGTAALGDLARLKGVRRPDELGFLARHAQTHHLILRNRRLMKRRAFLGRLTQHASEFREFHRDKVELVRKSARAIAASAADAEKEKEKAAEREERMRLKALRENDMAAYMRLLNERRSERLSFLVSQTDAFLQDLGAQLQQQRSGDEGENTKAAATGDEAAAGGGSEAAAGGGGGAAATGSAAAPPSAAGGESSTGSYFTIAHRIRERVTSQAGMLMGGTLKSYQLSGVEWLVSLYNNRLNGILADEMGLGKTIQTIALLCHLMERKNNRGPFLVIVPLSTMSNWANEFAKWAPDMSVVRYRGGPARRKELFRDLIQPGQFNVCLTTYEFSMRDKSSLKRLQWQYIVIDEGHRMKNAHCKFSQVLGTEYKSRNRLLLTGTPLQNSLPELWSLLNFLLPKIFASAENFEQWFAKPFATFKGGPGGGNESDERLSQEESMLVINRLHQVLRPFLLRRVKAEVLDQLPDKVERIVRCDLSAWQRAWYQQIQRFGNIGVDSAAAGADANSKKRGGVRSLNNALMQLRKVCNHPFLFMEEGYPLDETIVRSSGKFAVLDNMLPKLRRRGHRCLLFSQMTAAMHVMEDYLTMRGFRFLRLDGSTKAEDREKRMHMFNAPDSPYFIFLLSTRAGGLGINLATADTVIIFDSDWNPTADAQAQDRAHRIGQTQEVRVFRLVTTTPVEERILQQAAKKANMEAMVIHAGQFNQQGRQASAAGQRKALLEDLLTQELDAAKGQRQRPGRKGRRASTAAGGDEGDDELAAGMGNAAADGDDDAEQLNEMLARDEEELALFERMDAERQASRERSWRVSGGQGPVPGPVMEEREVPAWVNKPAARLDAQAAVREAAASYGRGSRKRGRVVYDDGLTESEWLEAVDRGGSSAEVGARVRELSQLKRSGGGGGSEGRPARQSAAEALQRLTATAQAMYDDDDYDGNDHDRDHDRDDHHHHHHQQQQQQQQQQQEEEEEEGRGAGGPAGAGSGPGSPGSSRKSPHKRSKGLSADEKRALARRAPFIREAIERMKALTAVDGRRLADLFLKKPSAMLYPDYYDIVKRPIALDTMSKRLQAKYYRSVQAFLDDVQLMVDNSYAYNPEGSHVRSDSDRLAAEAREVCAQLQALERREAEEAAATAEAERLAKEADKAARKRAQAERAKERSRKRTAERRAQREAAKAAAGVPITLKLNPGGQASPGPQLAAALTPAAGQAGAPAVAGGAAALAPSQAAGEGPATAAALNGGADASAAAAAVADASADDQEMAQGTPQ